MIENYWSFLQTVVSFAELVLNSMGIIIVLYSVVYGTIRHTCYKESAKHYICSGISHALNYNLATEVLKIITNRDSKELLLIAGIIILKFLITILFILELKEEELQKKIRGGHADKKEDKKSFFSKFFK